MLLLVTIWFFNKKRGGAKKETEEEEHESRRGNKKGGSNGQSKKQIGGGGTLLFPLLPPSCPVSLKKNYFSLSSHFIFSTSASALLYPRLLVTALAVLKKDPPKKKARIKKAERPTPRHCEGVETAPRVAVAPNLTAFSTRESTKETT